MISTRMHGIIDYAVALLESSLAASGWLSAPARTVLAVSAATRVGYAAMTDYEGGLQARLTMRQHLALDTACATGLAAFGLLARHRSAPRRARASRLTLLALAICQLAVVAFSSSTPRRGPGQGSGALDRRLGTGAAAADRVGYPPLDTVKPVADDVFIVDSLLPGLLGTILPVRMTILRLPDGDLLLHSPTPFSLDLQRDLEALGRIRYLLAPNIAHWTFLEAWQMHCPDAVTWAAPGLRKRRPVRNSAIRLDHELGEPMPEAWRADLTLVDVPGGLGFHECALFHVPSRTLVLTDLVLNLEAQKIPAWMRPVARKLGVVAPNGMPPVYLRKVVELRRDAAAQAAERLLALQPERVIFAHGKWFSDDAVTALRHSLRWLVDRDPAVPESKG